MVVEEARGVLVLLYPAPLSPSPLPYSLMLIGGEGDGGVLTLPLPPYCCWGGIPGWYWGLYGGGGC